MPPAIKSRLSVDALFAGLLVLAGATIGFVIKAEVADMGQTKDIVSVQKKQTEQDERIRSLEKGLSEIQSDTRVTRALMEEFVNNSRRK